MIKVINDWPFVIAVGPFFLIVMGWLGRTMALRIIEGRALLSAQHWLLILWAMFSMLVVR